MPDHPNTCILCDQPSKLELCMPCFDKVRRIMSVASNKARRAVKVGDIEKQPCVVCGSTNSVAHHPNYMKPLDVVWYCRIHHRYHHEAQPERAHVMLARQLRSIWEE